MLWNVMLLTTFATQTSKRKYRAKWSGDFFLSRNEYYKQEIQKKTILAIEVCVYRHRTWRWFEHRARSVRVFLLIWHIFILISWPLKWAAGKKVYARIWVTENEIKLDWPEKKVFVYIYIFSPQWWWNQL